MFSTVAHNCHGKTKNLTAKTQYLAATQKTSRQNQKPHVKSKYLTAKPKTSNLVLPWGFCFCLEVFGFAVTVVGHHSFCIKFEKNLPFVFQVTIHRMWAEEKPAFLSRFLFTPDLSRWFPKMQQTTDQKLEPNKTEDCTQACSAGPYRTL